MKTYFIDPASGQALRGAAPEQAALTLCLCTREEFSTCRDPLPRRGALLRALDAPRSCRAESYAHCVLGTLSLPGPPGLGFGFYLQAGRLYLVDGGPALAEQANRARQSLPEGCTAGDILLTLLYQLMEKDARRLMELGGELDRQEERLLLGTPANFYQTLLRYQRRLSALHTYYEQLIQLGETMDGLAFAAPGDGGAGGWRRYTARAERLHDDTETLREHLVQLRELYQAQVSAAQNRTMTLLTVVTSLFLPLSLIAGWYGMNFAYMPELSSPYGYVGVIVLSVCVVVAELLWFRHEKML